MCTSSCPNAICCKAYLCTVVLPSLLCQRSVGSISVSLFLALYSIPLTYLSVVWLIRHCHEDYSLMGSLEVRYCRSSKFVLLFPYHGGYSGSWVYDFRIGLSKQEKIESVYQYPRNDLLGLGLHWVYRSGWGEPTSWQCGAFLSMSMVCPRSYFFFDFVRQSFMAFLIEIFYIFCRIYTQVSHFFYSSDFCQGYTGELGCFRVMLRLFCQTILAMRKQVLASPTIKALAPAKNAHPVTHSDAEEMLTGWARALCTLLE